MKDLLAAYFGSEEAIAAKPVNTMAICPSPPLLWSDITCQNLMDCAKWGLPAVLISMPLSGATAPVTIAGTVVQHAAESLSGVVIHQLVNPSAPIIYGNSGGAVFLKRDDRYYFIGVPSRVSVSMGQAITHMGYFVPPTRIRKWCKDEELTFLVDPEAVPTECFDRREEMQKRAEMMQLKPKKQAES